MITSILFYDYFFRLIGYIKNNPKIEIDVRFVLNRLPLERMHQGVDQTVISGVVPSLFPDLSLSRKIHPNPRIIHEYVYILNPKQQLTN